MLRDALVEYEDAITKAVKVPISQNAFDALVDWTYNVGIHAMQSSTVIKRLNSRDYQGAADGLLAWDKAAGHVMQGLLHRRQEERNLFLTA
jgi:lysozyme